MRGLDLQDKRVSRQGAFAIQIDFPFQEQRGVNVVQVEEMALVSRDDVVSNWGVNGEVLVKGEDRRLESEHFMDFCALENGKFHIFVRGMLVQDSQ